MSFITLLATSFSQAVTGYQERASDRCARQVVSTLPENVQFIFNQVAKKKLVTYFSDQVSFYTKPHTSDVAVLKTKDEVSILFYVGGISERTVEIIDSESPVDDTQKCVLKIKDVVARVLIKETRHWETRHWEVDAITLQSDFAKCIKKIEGPYQSFSDSSLSCSELLLKEITEGMHPDFALISKDAFDKREYITAHIKVVDWPIEEGYRLGVLGNGLGMNDWKQPIPMHLNHFIEKTWYLTIRGKRETEEFKSRGKRETGEFTIVLLKPDNTGFKLELREPRKFKDLENPEDQELFPADFK